MHYPMTTDEGHAMHAALENLRVARATYAEAEARCEKIVAGARKRLDMPTTALLDFDMKKRLWSASGAVAVDPPGDSIHEMRSIVP